MSIDMLNERLGLEMIDGEGSIFHYTDTNALLKIIENKEFWITDSNFLNDSSETVYINNILSEVCSDFKLTDEFMKKLNIYCKKTINQKEKRYMISFSTDKDSLTLWSEFSGFYGCCIEFEINKLRSIFDSFIENNHNKCFVEGKVIYDRSKQKELLINMFERNINSIKDDYHIRNKIEINELFNNYEENNNEAIIKNLYYSLLGELKYYALFFKDECFKNENEYRIVFVDDGTKKTSSDELYFREKNGSIIPYIKMSLSNKENVLPIKSILVGSKNNSDISIDGVKYFLKKYNYNLSEITVSKSKITLRY